MKKRGFTLVELLAVLVLIAAISLIVFPSIINYINSTKGDINETTKQLIITSANQYLSDKYQQKLNTSVCFNLQTLIDNEYLEKTTITNQASKLDPNKTYLQADYIFDPDLKFEKYNIRIVTKCVTYGDVNLKGDVNSTDFDVLKEYIKGNSTLSEEALANADVTADGIVDAYDLSVLKYKTINEPLIDSLPYNIDTSKYIYGDLNLDGAVNEEDKEIIDDIVKKLVIPTDMQKLMGDLNLDGSVSTVDALILSRYLKNPLEKIPRIN